MPNHSFDLIVIGGGPAGISGANTAGIFGKCVALVEKLDAVGGAGINTGTIPSKTLHLCATVTPGQLLEGGTSGFFDSIVCKQ
jgi:NAD(P) transhydrogenase